MHFLPLQKVNVRVRAMDKGKESIKMTNFIFQGLWSMKIFSQTLFGTIPLTTSVVWSWPPILRPRTRHLQSGRKKRPVSVIMDPTSIQNIITSFISTRGKKQLTYVPVQGQIFIIINQNLICRIIWKYRWFFVPESDCKETAGSSGIIR